VTNSSTCSPPQPDNSPRRRATRPNPAHRRPPATTRANRRATQNRESPPRGPTRAALLWDVRVRDVCERRSGRSGSDSARRIGSARKTAGHPNPLLLLVRSSGGRYGSPQVHAQLVDAGRWVGENRVARWQGSLPRLRRPPPDPTGTAARAGLVHRDFTAGEPDEKWLSDIFCVPKPLTVAPPRGHRRPVLARRGGLGRRGPHGCRARAWGFVRPARGPDMPLTSGFRFTGLSHSRPVPGILLSILLSEPPVTTTFRAGQWEGTSAEGPPWVDAAARLNRALRYRPVRADRHARRDELAEASRSTNLTRRTTATQDP
jgi:hypothetical protein